MKLCDQYHERLVLKLKITRFEKLYKNDKIKISKMPWLSWEKWLSMYYSYTVFGGHIKELKAKLKATKIVNTV